MKVVSDTKSKSKWAFCDGLVSEKIPNMFTRADKMSFFSPFSALNSRLFRTLSDLPKHSYRITERCKFFSQAFSYFLGSSVGEPVVVVSH